MVLPVAGSLWHPDCCWLCCRHPQMDSVPGNPPTGTRTEPRYYSPALPLEAPLTKEPPLQCSAAAAAAAAVVVRRPRARDFALVAAAQGAQAADDWYQSQSLRSMKRVTGCPS